jgi:mRNA interferase YafQ
MRTIERSSAFKRDYKRAKVTPRHSKNLDNLLTDVIEALLSDEVLPASNRDHPLSGDWMGYLECHVKPDLLLIYRKPDVDTLRLARLGSHSELFRN